MQEATREPEPATQAKLAAQMSDIIRGYQTTQLLHVAADLGLADLLATGPKDVEALAAATSTHAGSLYRVLRALAGLGIFSEQDDGRFELTPLGGLLRTGSPGSQRAMALQHATEAYRLWGELRHSVKTGESAYEKLYGVSNWEYKKQHPEIDARFNAAMADNARQTGISLAETYPFPEQGVVFDIGGGNGTLLTTILSRYPQLHGVLVEQPHVVEQAHAVLAAAGVSDRCRMLAGDFFEAVPDGGDIYILSWVLHDWDDLRATEILRQCRRAMDASAKLLLIERVIPRGNTPSPTKLADVHMLVALDSGRERTEAEWKAVLEASGFRLASITPIALGFNILEALPA